MRIAIIGAGISGLVCAHKLHKRHEITVLEANDYPGGHSNTVDVVVSGKTCSVDTGFIVYNERNYPAFTGLIKELGVATRPTSMSFSVRSDPAALEFGAANFGTLFAQKRNLFRPGYWKMLRDVKRMMSERALLTDADPYTTASTFFKGRGYSNEFLNFYLLPLGAALWSCPLQTVLDFPIRYIGEFLSNHGMLQMADRPEWRVIHGGSKKYVEALIRPFRDRIELNTPISSIERFADHVEVSVAGVATPEKFDHVILACHADQALGMLSEPSRLECEILAGFPFQKNEVILHTDTTVLPKRKQTWSSWNYRVRNGAQNHTSVTYNMNILQGIQSTETICVSLNEGAFIDPSKVLRRFNYHHPVSTVQGMTSRKRHREVANQNRTSFCGAYWGYGFHEDGVQSALTVCNALGIESH